MKISQIIQRLAPAAGTLVAVLALAGAAQADEPEKGQTNTAPFAYLADGYSAQQGSYEAAVGRFLPMSGATDEGQYCMGVMYNGPLGEGSGAASADSTPMTWFVCAAEGNAPPFPQEFASADDPAIAPGALLHPAAYRVPLPDDIKGSSHSRAATAPANLAPETAMAPESAMAGIGRIMLIPARLSLGGMERVADWSGIEGLARDIGALRSGKNDIALGFYAAMIWGMMCGSILIGLGRVRRS